MILFLQTLKKNNKKNPTNPTPFLNVGLHRTGSFSYFIHLPNPEVAAIIVAFSNKP